MIVCKRKITQEFNEDDTEYIQRNLKRQKDKVALVNSYVQKQIAQTECIEAIRSEENNLISSRDWLSTRSHVELTLLLDSGRRKFVSGFSDDECKEKENKNRTKSDLLQLILDVFSPLQIEQFKQAYIQRLQNKCIGYIHQTSKNSNHNACLQVFKQAQQFRQEYVQRRMVTLFKAWLESKIVGFIFLVSSVASPKQPPVPFAFQYWKNDTTLVAQLGCTDPAIFEFTYNGKAQAWNRECDCRHATVFTDPGLFKMHYAECLFEYVQAHAYNGLFTDAEWVRNRDTYFLPNGVAVNNVSVEAELLALPLVNLKWIQICDETNCNMIEFQQVERLTSTSGSITLTHKVLCGCQNLTFHHPSMPKSDLHDQSWNIIDRSQQDLSRVSAQFTRFGALQFGSRRIHYQNCSNYHHQPLHTFFCQIENKMSLEVNLVPFIQQDVERIGCLQFAEECAPAKSLTPVLPIINQYIGLI